MTLIYTDRALEPHLPSLSPEFRRLLPNEQELLLRVNDKSILLKIHP